MSGLYHTPKVKFGRWLAIDRQAKDITGAYTCPYCPASSGRKFTTRNPPFKHMENDTEKRNDGRNDLDRVEASEETVNKKRRAKRQANDRKTFQHRTGFVYPDKLAQEDAIPDPSNKSFVLGGPDPEPSAKLMKYTEDCDISDPTKRCQGFVEDYDLWDPQTLLSQLWLRDTWKTTI